MSVSPSLILTDSSEVDRWIPPPPPQDLLQGMGVCGPVRPAAARFSHEAAGRADGTAPGYEVGHPHSATQRGWSGLT